MVSTAMRVPWLLYCESGFQFFLAPATMPRNWSDFQAGASDQRPVDVSLSEQIGGVFGLYAAAVLDTDVVGNRLIISLGEYLAKIEMHLLRLLGGGHFARPDGPNRLVGDDGFCHLLRC